MPANGPGTPNTDISSQLTENHFDATSTNATLDHPIEPKQAHPLTPDVIGQHVSVLSRTGNGLSHAYVRLEIHNKGITSLDGLTEFPHLRYLDLSENNIERLDQLANLEYLLTADLHSNDITAIPNSLEKCRFLQSLNASQNRISAFEVAASPLLVYLNLNENALSEIALKEFPELSHLELRANKLTTTEGIDAPKLKKLYIAQNTLTKIAGLNENDQLQTLHVRDNQVDTLDGFGVNMRNLSYLNLRNNKLASFAELDKLKVLPALKQLVLSQNPISEQDNYRLEVISRLPRLERLDKDKVTEEEREEAEQYRAQQEEKAKAEDQKEEEEVGETESQQ